MRRRERLRKMLDGRSKTLPRRKVRSRTLSRHASRHSATEAMTVTLNTSSITRLDEDRNHGNSIPPGTELIVFALGPGWISRLSRHCHTVGWLRKLPSSAKFVSRSLTDTNRRLHMLRVAGSMRQRSRRTSSVRCCALARTRLRAVYLAARRSVRTVKILVRSTFLPRTSQARRICVKSHFRLLCTIPDRMSSARMMVLLAVISVGHGVVPPHRLIVMPALASCLISRDRVFFSGLCAKATCRNVPFWVLRIR
jgi:hypothetical protein